LIVWTTDETSNSQVEYGLSNDYTSSTTIDLATSTSHTVNLAGLLTDSLYHFRVLSVDDTGNLSSSSDQTLTTLSNPDTEAPTVPTDFTASAFSSTEAALSWTDSTDNVGVVGYKIYRNEQEIASINSNTFQDFGLSPETQYDYSVAAFDAENNISDQTSQVTATTFSDQNTEEPTDLEAPSVSITEPEDESEVSDSVTINISATDNSVVSRVELYIDDVLFDSSDSASLETVWNTLDFDNGEHSLTAKAYDSSENVGETEISVAVNNQTTSETPVITSKSGSSRRNISSDGSRIISSQTVSAPEPVSLNSNLNSSSYVLIKNNQNTVIRGSSGPVVLNLQKFLNDFGFILATTGPGSPGNETDYFGLLTFNALVRFQEFFRDEILKPLGLIRGTGILGPRTRAKIFELLPK